MVPLSFCKHDFLALAEPALYWPAKNALLVADLHLEKASWFAAHGQMLPPYDSIETLRRLESVIEQTDAKHVYCLGDNFHDDDGERRLDGQAAELLRKLTATHDWLWISGNHDKAVEGRWGGQTAVEQEVSGIMLRHQAEAGENGPEISGHYHPKWKIRAKGRTVSSQCFVASSSKLILPSFGVLTGGLNANHPEICNMVGPESAALVVAGDKLCGFPISR